jgi:LacI family transcriptional regulator
MAATIKDVAREANVSVASVSRVLNGHGNVTDETRDRILSAAERLHYIPNSGARSLITRRTDTIGVILPDMHGEFFSEIVRGIDVAARARGLHLLVSGSHGDAAETAAAIRAMSGRVDGLLVMSPHADEAMLAQNLPSGLPTVLMNTRVAGNKYSSLAVDNYGGAYVMVSHLVECGHRRIALISGPDDNFDAQERLRGYREALAALLPNAHEQVLRGDFSEESGYLAGKQILALRERPQAIFAANDMMAIGCLFALTEAGVQVPRDVSLAGFDDVPIARYITPPLTTVRVQIADLGGRALEHLALTIEDPEHAKVSAQVLRPELVVRASCATPGASRP